MKTKKTFLVMIIMIAIIATATGCSPSDSSKAPTEGNIVNIEGNEYLPAEITIKKGESVVWVCKDTTKHDVTFDTFQSPLLGKGESFEYTFDTVGTYEYFDLSLTFMKAKVIVIE